MGLRETLAEELRGALDRGRDALGRQVLQRDGEGAHRRPRRDVAAHGTGADDVEMADVGRAALAETLEPLLEREYANQVPRRGMEEEACRRSGMLARHVAHVAAEVLPQVDDRVGRGILVAP